VPSPAGQRQHQRAIWLQPAKGGRKAARGPRGAREPRPQPRISRMWHGGWRVANFVAFPRPTGSPRWAAIRATTKKARSSSPKVDGGKMRGRFLRGGNLAEGAPRRATAKLGVVGFCFGGTVTNALAGADGLGAFRPRFRFYGRPAESRRRRPRSRPPLLANYGELDNPHHVGDGRTSMPALTAAKVAAPRLRPTWAPITASTTTRRPVTTNPPPSSPGSARLDWFNKYLRASTT